MVSWARVIGGGKQSDELEVVLSLCEHDYEPSNDICKILIEEDSLNVLETRALSDCDFGSEILCFQVVDLSVRGLQWCLNSASNYIMISVCGRVAVEKEEGQR